MASPAKLDPFNRLQFNMIHVHNTFKYGLDRIFHFLENPPMNDLYNFLGYCETWAVGLVKHHDGEEAVVFPFLQQKLDMSTELREHEFIHKTLDEILVIIRAAKDDNSKFDAAQLKEALVTFKGPLYQHLDEEIKHVSPENLQVFTAEELHDMLERLVKYSHKDNPFTAVPYILTHTPPEYKDIWPEMPWFLKKVVTPYVFALRHAGYWKYAPYGY